MTTILPVHAAVESVDWSPTTPVANQSITFFGKASVLRTDQIIIEVSTGYCSVSNENEPYAFQMTIVDSNGMYNVTFYQGLPTGLYSVTVQTSFSNNGGICRDFSVM